MSDSITREEQYLNAIANGESIDLKPITREEQFLAKAAGQNVKVPTPITRKEMFLDRISSNGGVGKPEQEKTVDITQNGTTEITADEGFTLSKVTANVNVSASGENKLAQLASKTITEVTEKDLEGATAIEQYMFYNCKKLISVDMPSSIKSIGDNAFYQCEKLISVDIPSSVTSLGRSAFYWCEKLTNITIPDSVRSVGNNVFEYCRNLQSAIVGNSVKSVPKYMFAYCSNLTSVTFLYDIADISQYAFFGCDALTNFTLPSSVTYIETKALHLGTTENKATITFLRTTPPTINNQTFDANKLNKIIVPKGCGEAYKSATNWANFADYIEEAAE